MQTSSLVHHNSSNATVCHMLMTAAKTSRCANIRNQYVLSKIQQTSNPFFFLGLFTDYRYERVSNHKKKGTELVQGNLFRWIEGFTM